MNAGRKRTDFPKCNFYFFDSTFCRDIITDKQECGMAHEKRDFPPESGNVDTYGKSSTRLTSSRNCSTALLVLRANNFDLAASSPLAASTSVTARVAQCSIEKTKRETKHTTLEKQNQENKHITFNRHFAKNFVPKIRDYYVGATMEVSIYSTNEINKTRECENACTSNRSEQEWGPLLGCCYPHSGRWHPDWSVSTFLHSNISPH